MRNPILILATAIAAGALSLGLWSWQQWTQTLDAAEASETLSATVLPDPRALPDLKLTDHNGQTVSLTRLKNNWHILFLGFTHCPDVCPNTLGLLANVKQALDKNSAATNLGIIFISVDPGRDSPDKLKKYVEYFDEDMIGLTGSQDVIDQLTAGLYLPYAIDEADASGNYNVEHSGALVLVGPDAAVHAYFTPPHSASSLISDLRQLTLSND